MVDENKIRDAADAVKGVVEAVPVYQDALQPAVREIGRGLQTVAKTIHIALAPVAALVWGYEAVKEFVETRVAEKLRHVPPERIKTPEPHVVVPALQALRYTGHQETLRELYANLLATSLDADTCRHAHPAFVEMIKNMSPDEARIMRLFALRETFPLIDVHVFTKGEDSYEIPIRAFSFVGREAGCEFPDLTPSYLDNLTRLGLIESPGAYGLGPSLAAPNTYEPLEQAEEIAALKSQVEQAGGRIEFDRTFVGTTHLGRQFCRACVMEKSSAAGQNAAG